MNCTHSNHITTNISHETNFSWTFVSWTRNTAINTWFNISNILLGISLNETKNDIKFNPSILESESGKPLNVLWSSYIAYQKFQRYISGDTEKNDYYSYIKKQNSSIDTCFPFYGSDLEIFGYKNPVERSDGDGNEINRFREILDLFSTDNQIEFLFHTFCEECKLSGPIRSQKVSCHRYQMQWGIAARIEA